jgi:hypothetical protein
MAESGVMQAGEAQRQAAMADLQSYGIDPSSGRYAALDNANRVQMAASAAGAGNQQRMATEAYGNTLEQQGIQSSLANAGFGLGTSQATQGLLGVGMQLPYSPLGQTSQSKSQSSGQNTSTSYGGAGGGTNSFSGNISGSGGGVFAQGGFVSPSLSDSHGEEVDDVPARLNAGEFVIPKDVVTWKGREFFNKLISQARKTREGNGGPQKQPTGYQDGGDVYGDVMPSPFPEPPEPPKPSRSRRQVYYSPPVERIGRMVRTPGWEYPRVTYPHGGYVSTPEWDMPGPYQPPEPEEPKVPRDPLTENDIRFDRGVPTGVPSESYIDYGAS